MDKNFRKIFGVAAMGLSLALPAVIHADGSDFQANVNDDDQAHFQFSGPHHHHPWIWKAAKQLRQTKHSLWNASHNFGGHKARAIADINAALDELAAADAYADSIDH